MQLLEERILRDGVVREGDVLKVDSFLNHQMDVPFFSVLADEFARLYADGGVNKILTIEASGIGIACITAQRFGCPLVFAKKSRSSNLARDVWSAEVKSYTYGSVYQIVVSKEYLRPGDRVLVIDDFLATGAALRGLIRLVRDAGATLVGAGIVIEKAYQSGGEELRREGVRVESLARIQSMSVENGISFC